MNRRTLIIASAVAAVGIFAGGALFYGPPGDAPPAIGASGRRTTGPAHAPVLGPADAPVTIVEFFDPACESCRAFYPVVKKIMAAYPDKVRVVLRYAAFHPTSEEAIRILEAARLQDKFEPVLERLLQTQSRWAPHGRPAESAWAVLDGTGLDTAQARKDEKSPEIAAILNQDAEDIETVGVRGTPTFFVNGKPLKELGAQQLYDLITAEVNEQ